jgi:hypothetical protein
MMVSMFAPSGVSKPSVKVMEDLALARQRTRGRLYCFEGIGAVRELKIP